MLDATTSPQGCTKHMCCMEGTTLQYGSGSVQQQQALSTSSCTVDKFRLYKTPSTLNTLLMACSHSSSSSGAIGCARPHPPCSHTYGHAQMLPAHAHTAVTTAAHETIAHRRQGQVIVPLPHSIAHYHPQHGAVTRHNRQRHAAAAAGT